MTLFAWHCGNVASAILVSKGFASLTRKNGPMPNRASLARHPETIDSDGCAICPFETYPLFLIKRASLLLICPAFFPCFVTSQPWTAVLLLLLLLRTLCRITTTKPAFVRIAVSMLLASGTCKLLFGYNQRLTYICPLAMNSGAIIRDNRLDFLRFLPSF